MTSPAVDVLIVGAGPTGLTMALELALNHVSFRIIEKSTARSDTSRAIVMHARTFELLRRHGLSETLQRRGTVGTGAKIYVNKQNTVNLNVQDLALTHTAFPWTLWVSQADTESITESHLESTYGIEVERGAVAGDIGQDDSGADVTITTNQTSERFRFSYVIGCDGAHSAVRRAAGLSFEGAPYPQDFVMCDAHLKWDQARETEKPITIFFGTAGMLVMFPMKGNTVRLVVSRPPDVLQDRTADDDPTQDDFKTMIGIMVPGEPELYDPIWLASFRLHHRGVDSYRNRRIFVAGDAARIHSPAAGQGMNTGIQDAVNLGWKLAYVLSSDYEGHTVGETWLDSYDEERRPVGIHLLNTTDKVFGYGATTNFFWISWRNFLATWILPWLVSSRRRRTRFFRFVSQLGIRYRFSSITRASKGTPLVKGGDRAPDSRITIRGQQKWLSNLWEGDKHHLVLFSGAGARGIQPDEMDATSARFRAIFSQTGLDSTKIHKVHASAVGDESDLFDVEDRLHKLFGFEEPGYVLIRPDGYVACVDVASQSEDFVQWVERYWKK